MHRTFFPQPALGAAEIARVRPLTGNASRPARAEEPIASELVAAVAIDRNSPWPTHRIRSFLQSQANRGSTPR